jgi:hypothetical protein
MTSDNCRRWTQNTESCAAVAQLFAQSAPVLVEVRFPNMATSPDWHLLDDEEELDALLERVGPQAELYLNSVWDLSNPKGPVRLKKA